MRPILLVLVLAACDADAKTPPRKQVTAKTLCSRSEEAIIVHAIFDVAYTKISYGPPRTIRQLYSFACRPDGTCKGQIFDLNNVDDGKPITAMDIGTMEGAEVVSVAGDIAVVRWGPLRTFTIDFERKEVTYVESNDSTYGRATVRCP